MFIQVFTSERFYRGYCTYGCQMESSSSRGVGVRNPSHVTRVANEYLKLLHISAGGPQHLAPSVSHRTHNGNLDLLGRGP